MNSRRLGTLVSKIGSGVTPRGGRASYVSAGVPIIRSQNVRDGRLDLSDVAYVSEQLHERMKRSHVLPGDVLLNITGASIGRSCVVPAEVRAANVNQHVCILRPGKELKPEFLHAILELPSTQHRIRTLAAGGSREGLNYQQVAALRIAYASPAVQARLVEIRGTCNRLIDATSNAIIAKRAFKHALMQELLSGRRRFPEFTGQAWPVRPLGEIASINPESLPESTDPHKEIRYIEISALRGAAIMTPPHSIPFGESPSRARRIVRRNDVLFSTVRPYLQGFALVDEESCDDLVCSTGFAVIRPQNATDARFILENLYSARVSRQANACLVGSNYPALNEGDVRRLAIPWPTAEEREKITHVLWAARMEITGIEGLSEHYETLKRGLMQRLLSGDLEIPEHLGNVAVTELEADRDDP